MAEARIELTQEVTSSSASSVTVKVTMKFYGNGVSHSNYEETGKITLNGVSKTFSHKFTSSTSAQTMGSASFTIPKAHTSKSYTAKGTFAAGAHTNLSTLEDTISVSVGAKTSYTVSFSANGGSGAPSNQKKWYDETLSLSSTKPSRSGYTFSKWNTNSSGTGTNYSSGGSYTKNASLSLYAKWTANKYTLTYNANGGSVSSTTKSVTYNQAYGTLQTPTRTGYTFNGWNTKKDGSGSTVTANTVCKGNDTIYAQWTEKTATLTYNANGHGTAPSSVTMRYTTKTNAASISASGYVFNGWNTNSAGTGTTYQAGSIIKKANVVPSNKTLYAIWSTAYVNPVISNLEVQRGILENGDFIELSSGNRIKISYTWSAGKDTSGVKSTKNVIKVGDSSIYTETFSAANGDVEKILDNTYDIGVTNTVKVTITDVTSSVSVSKTANIPKGGYQMHFSKTGKQVTFFGLCDDEDDEALDDTDSVIVNGDVYSSAGKLMSASITTGNGTKSSVPSGASNLTNLAEVSLNEKGIYLLLGRVRFASNTSGRRGAAWASNSTGYFYHSLVVGAPANGGATLMQTMAIIEVTSNTAPYKAYLNCYHTAGASNQLDVEYYWRYIKLA